MVQKNASRQTRFFFFLKVSQTETRELFHSLTRILRFTKQLVLQTYSGVGAGLHAFTIGTGAWSLPYIFRLFVSHKQVQWTIKLVQ